MLQRQIMQRLYGEDVWAGFEPDRSAALQGWNGDHPLLPRLAAKARIIVDVGVWKGQSTIAMAGAMREAGVDGVVIAVDTFLGSPEHWKRSKGYFKRSFGAPDLQAQFMSNVANAGLSDYVIPMPQTSTNAAIILGNNRIAPDLVHIDAAHELEPVMGDMASYWVILRAGGLLVGDDYDACWPGVVNAVRQFGEKEGVAPLIDLPKFVFAKPDVKAGAIAA